MNKYLSLKNYVNKFNAITFNLFTPVIKKYETKRIKAYGTSNLKHQPVFIIGAPRTGSTILYQAITNQSDVLYIDNLVCKFYRNLFFGFQLSQKLLGGKAHNSFKSDHGDTTRFGWRAPSECGCFWYRWLPTEKHFVDHNEVPPASITEIREEVTACSNFFDRPIVFKNLNAGQRLRMLVEAFPNASLVFVRRDPLYTAQSIIKAKRKLGIADNTLWSVLPSNHKELEGLDWPEQVVKQIYFLEKQIAEDVRLFSQDNVYELNYSDLTHDLICDFVRELGFKERPIFKKSEIKSNEKHTIAGGEIALLQAEINKLDWSKTYVK